jgi:hypothetical protein
MMYSIKFLPFCLRMLFRLSEMFIYFTNTVYRLGKRVILNRTSLFQRHDECSHPYLVFEFQLFDVLDLTGLYNINRY